MAPVDPLHGNPSLALIRLRIVDLDSDLPEVRVFELANVRVEKDLPWTESPTSTGDQPELLFAGAHGRRVTMDLVFDHSGPRTSVEPQVDGLFAMANIIDSDGAEDKKHPPRLALEWTGGVLPRIEGVIASLSARYLEFANDGAPIKAIVGLVFREASRARFHPS